MLVNPIQERIHRARIALSRTGKHDLESMDELESPDARALPALFEVQTRVEGTVGELHDIVKEYLNDENAMHCLVDEIAAKGSRALNLLAAGADEKLAQDSAALSGLEAIIRTDGSRPSYLILDGGVDLASSPGGSWRDLLIVDADLLRKTLACVGRGQPSCQGPGLRGHSLSDPGKPGSHQSSHLAIHRGRIEQRGVDFSSGH